MQPVVWNYAVDTLNLTPEPDYIILADECKDYHHRIPCTLSGEEEEGCKHVNVLNPGNFS